MRWWPVAFALQRLEDTRGLNALLSLAKDAHPYTRAFAVKGLAALKDRAALPVLMPLLTSGDRPMLSEAIERVERGEAVNEVWKTALSPRTLAAACPTCRPARWEPVPAQERQAVRDTPHSRTGTRRSRDIRLELTKNA